MLSYPNCNGRNKILQNSDARALAELCESIGLDFQINLLTRSPESVLISTIVHRNFGLNFGYQAELYHYVHKLIFGQLRNMDPRFLVGCIDIEADAKENRNLLSPLKQTINLTDARMHILIDKSRKTKEKATREPL